MWVITNVHYDLRDSQCFLVRKQQTIIEPTIDMWTREKRLNNIVVNDPKGELTVKFYEPATVRGYDVVQFNLINAMKTDIYNPLALAANSAREGDFTKCAAYTENIADVFFPVDGAEDPVWPNAANNAFKRAVYGMIDYYMEEETRLREEAANNPDMSQALLETKIDQLWGHVTLYNCYQMFVRLSSKKVQNPVAEVKALQKENAVAASAGEPPKYTPEELQQKIISANKKGVLWNGAPDVDALTLYFNATAKLPVNGIRTLAVNSHNSLLAMGGADKMIASWDLLCA